MGFWGFGVLGFSGRTFQYLSSYAVDYVINVQNPSRIDMREASLAVIDRAMESSDADRIKYAAKQSRISNAYKKWIGQNMGLERYRALEMKREKEAEFAARLAESPAAPKNQGLLANLEELYSNSRDYQLSRDYLIEFYYYGPEALRFSMNFKNVIENYDSLEANGLWSEELEKLNGTMEGFYKNYNPEIDEAIFRVQAPLFIAGCPSIMTKETLLYSKMEASVKEKNQVQLIYEESIFDNQEELSELLKKSGKKVAKELADDPIYIIASELLDNYLGKVRSGYAEFQENEGMLMKEYLRLTMELFPDEDYWPDANSTMRLTYGKMEGSQPQDGMGYTPYTTLEGIFYKYVPGDKEFDVPEKLLELYHEQDYGPYATNGEMRVCFLGSNHTTGGNSGSPALNDRGQLVGLNFDRTWESTMSDIMFNSEICRNIMVDAKYILFIVDKFAGAGHLVEEMNLVYPEKTPKEVNDIPIPVETEN